MKEEIAERKIMREAHKSGRRHTQEEENMKIFYIPHTKISPKGQNTNNRCAEKLNERKQERRRDDVASANETEIVHGGE